ncbi:MAG: VOC family protein [Candidatus Poribacteria bacterium]|nr:VOC family protein [Candidatus Poribacteria bacterium]
MITGIHHFSLTVSDMERALAFYTQVIGMAVISDVRIQESPEHSVTRIPGARLRIVHLHGYDCAIELIQYLSPIGKPLDTRTCDTGSAHIAFIVDDMEATYRDLRRKGVRFKSEPVVTGTEVGTIVKSVYFLDPDGITLELVEIGKK